MTWEPGVEDGRSTTFVARHGSRWWACQLGSDEPVPLALGDLIAHLPPIQPPSSVPDPPSAASTFSEVRAWIGDLRPDGIHLEAVDGHELVLDALDVTILDALDQHPTASAVADAIGVPPAPIAARLARLARAGRVLVDGPHLGSAAGRIRAAEPSETATTASHEAASPTSDPGLARHPRDPGTPGRVPVYAVWHRHVGPLLSLGMLTAAARHHRGGALEQHFEIRRPETAESCLADLGLRDGPGILLLSDYVWSIQANLELAAKAMAVNPDLLVVHGGPSCPKYEADARAFLADHGDIAHILVRGEGEEVICEILERAAEAIDADATWGGLTERLSSVEGITFVGADGSVVRTPERDRISDLDALPSPYLTGEFDHIEPDAWNYCLPVETTRGCPYGCTFCDWGSDTMARIRRFDLDRVTEEIEWVAERGIVAINIPDANFGISKRDVETTRRVADARARTGFPQVMVFYPAKNTTKHLVTIMDLLGEAQISSAASLSLQTTDPETLAALDRSNIATEHFVALAADYRRRKHPLQGDLLMGIPGQTYENYRRDLQFMLDHEILVRTWPVQLLPNAPMNDPEYRARHGIEVDEDQVVIATRSFTADDRRQMLRLRKIDIITERLAVMRHLLRWLQWDHGIDATLVMDRIRQVIDERPAAYPALTVTIDHFDLFPAPAIGWRRLYDEIGRFVRDELGVDEPTVLADLLELQWALMPQTGRSLPCVVELRHDYLSYYRSAVRSLWTDGSAGRPDRRLVEHGPGTITVEDDPLQLCTYGIDASGDNRSETMQGDFLIGSSVANELRSPLMRLLPLVGAHGLRPDPFDGAYDDYVPEPQDRGTRVELLRRAREAILPSAGEPTGQPA